MVRQVMFAIVIFFLTISSVGCGGENTATAPENPIPPSDEAPSGPGGSGREKKPAVAE